MKNFKVSVIIPVYNAEKFLTDAVNSALIQEEVGEILLVEDRSPDNAMELCKSLVKSSEKIKLLTHPNNENRGAGASRNLGIKNACSEHIAFLDADDRYLKNRFLKDKEIFLRNNKVDAVYSTAVVKDKNGYEKRFYGKVNIRARVGYEADSIQFYKERLNTPFSLIHTNAVTFKKKFLLENKLFDERLRLHQDSELWKRLMRKGNFFPGELQKPVAEIREHDENRITSRNFNSELKFIAVSIDNIGIENLYDFEIPSFFTRALRLYSKQYKNQWERRFFYYFSLLKFSSDKKKFLKRIKEQYKDLNI